MGSQFRKMKRDAAKKAYALFKENWKQTRKAQSKMTDREKRRAVNNGQQILGKCPTFRMWWTAVRSPNAFGAAPEEVQEHIESLDWDD